MPQEYIYRPNGIDRYAPCRSIGSQLHSGLVVVKVQPAGCPQNGTMGHCYVAVPGQERDFQLVLESSLVLPGSAVVEDDDCLTEYCPNGADVWGYDGYCGECVERADDEAAHLWLIDDDVT